MLNYSLIGYGTIGEALVKASLKGLAGNAHPVAILEAPARVGTVRQQVQALGVDILVTGDSSEFLPYLRAW